MLLSLHFTKLLIFNSFHVFLTPLVLTERNMITRSSLIATNSFIFQCDTPTLGVRRDRSICLYGFQVSIHVIGKELRQFELRQFEL